MFLYKLTCIQFHSIHCNVRPWQANSMEFFVMKFLYFSSVVHIATFHNLIKEYICESTKCNQNLCRLFEKPKRSLVGNGSGFMIISFQPTGVIITVTYNGAYWSVLLVAKQEFHIILCYINNNILFWRNVPPGIFKCKFTKDVFIISMFNRVG